MKLPKSKTIIKGGKKREVTMEFKRVAVNPVRFEAFSTILTVGGQHVGFFAPTAELLSNALIHLGHEATGPWVPEKFQHINITPPIKP